MASVNPAIESLYQEIGESLLSFAGDFEGRLLLYADADEGTVSASVFGRTRGGDGVEMRFAPDELHDLVYSLWEEWREQPDQREWRVIAYVVDGDDFSIDLTYPDQINDPGDVDDPAFRKRNVEKYFPGEKIDFSAA